MKRIRIWILAATAAACLNAQSPKVDRMDEAASVISEIMATSDRAVPQDLLDKSQCVVIVPGLKKGAFIFGAKFGKGYLVCRAKSGPGWGAPGAVRIEGGSFGFQVGGSSSDVLLLVMNERGMDKLLASKFTIGGDATAAAGPVGRSVDAQTDARLSAELLSYSRSRGLFAGISLQGATLRQDLDENRLLYGKDLENRQIVDSATPPPSAKRLLELLNKYSSRRTQ